MESPMTNNKVLSKTDYFSGSDNAVSASSPGRLDVMGGIADYSGSLVLESSIKERTTVTLCQKNDETIRVYSGTVNEEIRVSKEILLKNSYSHLRDAYKNSWALYVLGCLAVLHKEKNIPITGMSIWVESEVPLGKGVSSSAAIEVATIKALDKLYRLNLGDTELPILAQKVENLVVGAPCGLMDQLTSYLGEENKLLPILCQPDKVFPSLNVPEDLYFVGIDSGIRHSVGGASYGDVRTAAFMGYSIIAHSLGINKEVCVQARVSGDRNTLPYKGYLANISPSEFYQKFFHLLPDTIKGEAFLAMHESIDHVTLVEKDRTYSVKQCAMHPIQENNRVNLFQTLLRTYALSPDQQYKEDILLHLGELMYQSHSSYSLCGLGNEHTDLLVSLAREAGQAKKVYGAKITGGGSGGTVVFLAKGKEGLASLNQIVDNYKIKTGIDPYIFKGSSQGGKYSN